MGLDVCVYRGLRTMAKPELDADGYPVDPDVWRPGRAMEVSETYWPGRGMPLQPDTYYTYERRYSFRAGSYGWYTEGFRLPLFDLISVARPRGDMWHVPLGPFHELLNFADNEGVIGQYVAMKLAKDFADWLERAETFSQTLGEEGEYFFETYIKFMIAFEDAARNGAVQFC